MTELVKFKDEADLKTVLAGEYRKQIENYFGDPQKALEFLSSVVASVQRTPKLLECTPESLVNSFITMAQLKLMPSEVSGEAYVLPYKNVAQFQIGYQGLVTLFYRSGVKSIIAEIVYDKDEFSYINGVVEHNADPFQEDRGEPKGAYVIVELQTGGKVNKAMNKKEIMDIGSKFSKSFKSEYSPWNVKNDPQLWMWRKTVLKQVAKLVPKNETIAKAISEDNKDSIISDRKAEVRLLGNPQEVSDDEVGEIVMKIHSMETMKELIKYYAGLDVQFIGVDAIVQAKKEKKLAIEEALQAEKEIDADS